MPDRSDRDDDRKQLHVRDKPDRINVNVNLSPLDIRIVGGTTGTDSTAILAAIQQLAQRINVMAGELESLTAEVDRNTTVDGSIITLVEGLAAKIESMKTDPAKLQALADSLRSSSDRTAAAVVAHTPAEEPPP